MLVTRNRAHRRRAGAAIVETALVMGVLAMLMFGIFEYCRFLLVLHITHNAARDGVRYAAVNLDKPNDFDINDYTDGSGKVYPSISRYTRERMGHVDRQLAGFRVAVYPVDNAGLQLTPPVVRPKTRDPSQTTFPDPYNQSDPNLPEWNEAVFTERVAVTIRGTYRTAVPTLLLMPSTIEVNVTALACSEGG
jgi:hypothetical protein